ncbi:MAG TPA: DUF488 domain-containing protein [Chloroflexia bacterium]|nr:DUF488 domain-containing protein [Chloroflexia bacterium]
MSEIPSQRDLTIFTIGHSNHSIEAFLELLQSHQIEVLVDIRSQPYSRYSSQFNAPELKQAIKRTDLKYLYMGKELGGRPENREFYDQAGHVLYNKVAQSTLFLSGIARLEQGIENFRVAIMCSEEDPLNCHRRLLVGRVLKERGINLAHIRGDGALQSEADLVKPQPDIQLSLFLENDL